VLHQPAKNVGGRVAGVLERPSDGGLPRLGFLGCEKRVALTSRVFFSASKYLSMLKDRRAEFNTFLADVGGRAAGQGRSFAEDVWAESIHQPFWQTRHVVRDDIGAWLYPDFVIINRPIVVDSAACRPDRGHRIALDLGLAGKVGEPA
jgi:hypothetical protein